MQIRTAIPRLLGIVLILSMIVPILGGCTEHRYLTKEQDEAVYQMCANGCMVIPQGPPVDLPKRGVGV